MWGALLCSRLSPSSTASGSGDLVAGGKVLDAKYALHLGEARWVPTDETVGNCLTMEAKVAGSAGWQLPGKPGKQQTPGDGC